MYLYLFIGRQSPGNDLEKSTDTLPGSSPGLATAGRTVHPATMGSPDFLPASGNRGDKRRPESSTKPSDSGILKNVDDIRRRANSNVDATNDQGFYAGAVGGGSYDSGLPFQTVSGGDASKANSDDSGCIPRNYSGGIVGSSSPFNSSSAFSSPVKTDKNFGNDSVEILSNDVQETLKITDQQHVKIDASRLSAVIDIFDPLAQESNNNTSHADGKTLDLDNEDGLSSSSYELLGTRPKVHDLGPMPKIAFVSPSVDEGQGDQPDNMAADSAPRTVQMRPKFAFMEPGVEPLAADTFNAFGDSAKGVEHGRGSGSGKGSGPGAHRETGLDYGSNGPLVDLPINSSPRSSQLEASNRSLEVRFEVVCRCLIITSTMFECNFYILTHTCIAAQHLIIHVIWNLGFNKVRSWSVD